MEYKKKCNVCGKVFCYTDEDLRRNASDAGMGALSALGGLASALGGGTIFHTHHLTEQANRYSDKVIDYNQCPYCHSRDLSVYSGDAHVDAPAANLPEVKTISINTTASTESLMKRVFLFLEDGDWGSADAYCEACLDRDPELAAAYLGKLMAELHVGTQEELKNQEEPFDKSNNYRRAVRFADEELKNSLIGCIEYINTRNENTRKDQILSEAKETMIGEDISDYEKAIGLFESISGWKDADQQKSRCIRKIAALKAEEEAARLERERLAELERKKREQKAEAARIRARKNKKLAMIITPVVVVAIIAGVFVSSISKKNDRYQSAIALMNNGQYVQAIEAFTELGSYKDCPEQIKAAENAIEALRKEEAYANALMLLESGQIESQQEAYTIFSELGEYQDSQKYLLGFQRKLTGEQYTTADSDYYNYDAEYTYNQIGQLERVHIHHHRDNQTGFRQVKTYRYNSDGKTSHINYSYPDIDASEYAPTTVIGHSYIYDAEGRIYDLQSLQHNATTLHTYHLWYNEDGERISGRIGSPGWLSPTCIKSILNASGEVLKTWEEKVDIDGNPTGEISNMIEYVYDENGKLLEQIRDNRRTYYHYQNDLLIREECGTHVKNYVYTENGDLEFVEETVDGNYLARTTYTYSMLYLPDANAAE